VLTSHARTCSHTSGEAPPSPENTPSLPGPGSFFISSKPKHTQSSQQRAHTATSCPSQQHRRVCKHAYCGLLHKPTHAHTCPQACTSPYMPPDVLLYKPTRAHRPAQAHTCPQMFYCISPHVPTGLHNRTRAPKCVCCTSPHDPKQAASPQRRASKPSLSQASEPSKRRASVRTQAPDNPCNPMLDAAQPQRGLAVGTHKQSHAGTPCSQLPCLAASTHEPCSRHSQAIPCRHALQPAPMPCSRHPRALQSALTSNPMQACAPQRWASTHTH